VAFGAERDAIHFNKADLHQPLPTANAEMARASESVIDEYLAHMDQNDVVTRVRVALIDLLPSGSVTEDQVAASLNMSLRTLQRKLNDTDTTYKEVLDGTRRDLAIQYVRSRRMPIGEVSYLLGFAEPSNFTRAFKRWTGSSPSDFRDSA
jgi:AraC-like DNA-binding protein